MSLAHPVPGHALASTETSRTSMGYEVAAYTCECGKTSQKMGSQHILRGHANHARIASRKERT